MVCGPKVITLSGFHFTEVKEGGKGDVGISRKGNLAKVNFCSPWENSYMLRQSLQLIFNQTLTNLTLASPPLTQPGLLFLTPVLITETCCQTLKNQDLVKNIYGPLKLTCVKKSVVELEVTYMSQQILRRNSLYEIFFSFFLISKFHT